MFRAIIFDMDGVIVNSEPIHGQIVQRIFDKYGIDISEKEHQSFIGGTSRAMWDSLIRQFNLDITVDALLKEDQRAYLRKLASFDRLKTISGARQILDFATKHGMPLGLASSSSRANIDLVLAKTNLINTFDVTISGEEVESSKPSPEIFLKVADALNQDPEQTIVIEDSENGTIGAKSAGMWCIGYQNTHSGKQNLSRADWIVDDLSDAHQIIKEQIA